MRSIGFFVVALLFLGLSLSPAQNRMANSKQLKIVHIPNDFPISSLDSGNWDKAKEIIVKTYWSGKSAPVGRHFKTRLLWSDTALYVRYEANQNEPLVVSDKPDLTRKTKGLWDRDVCEIFIAPNKAERNKYFEFEIAPTGEWIDLGIEVTSTKRETDWYYASGMRSMAMIEDDTVVMAIKIPWQAFGETPKAGDIWLGNLFRCVGKDLSRGYLSWQPTKTPKPNFHVPEKFGEFRFVK